MCWNRWCAQAEQIEQLRSQSQNKTRGGQVRRAGWCWLPLAPSSPRGPFRAVPLMRGAAVLSQAVRTTTRWGHFLGFFLTTEIFTLSFAEREVRA